MLFSITREQYQRYKDTADQCRQYILERYSRLCEIVNTFNRYFGSSNVDIYGSEFMDKSLLLKLLEHYDRYYKRDNVPFKEYLEDQFDNSDYRSGWFSDLSIYVYWPSVTVTNERNQSVVVTDLYARIPIYANGRLCGRFQLARATYTYEQYVSKYLHSHIRTIPANPSVFQDPCLGSGPLIRTQQTLSSYDQEDLWDLFCVELDKYVHVESIAGTPYNYLSRIGTGELRKLEYNGYRHTAFKCICENASTNHLFKMFFRYVLARKKLKFAYTDGMFTTSCNNTEWIIRLSKIFLKFFAMMESVGTDVTLDYLLSKRLLIKVKINNGVIYTTRSSGRSSTDYFNYRDLYVLYFKGEQVKSYVNDPVQFNDNVYYILNPVLALAFQDQCINYLNIYEHEKAKNVIQEESEIISGNSDGGSCPHRGKNAFPDYPIGEKRVCVSL